ncbi:AcrR family transcriptional regulator [Amycolatopsis bartoniae]|uniref:TetR family transcriptional regulator n=1 Tax=Amycolatopsis bartoniae TaxID=941986 RepID=A0A8H9IVH8_9PSEU|nr:TetR/AcrR family transcriptional regulator [Amycolatopsis bartoniae]MBB2938941.1 AcrR family transcriptional regulator [Amycolatopsis bartoniae]TVT11252.1 TetR/AcrR family transcriptional regulator [Amycolatopsis bartoniae]GHF66031.1 TetR family transcriptional regulator [Amycolatopsis bartoniae]
MPEPKPRRRGKELEDVILDITWVELVEVGYNRLTIESVAKRARTSKPVIYRRWSNRAELVLAAWARQTPTEMAVPIDTGSLRGDLIALFRRVAERANSVMTEVIAGVMGEAFRHPEVVELLHQRLRQSPMSSTLQAIVDRAVARGELDPVELPARVTRVPLDLIRNETLLCRGPMPEQAVIDLVDEVYLPLLHGLAARSVEAVHDSVPLAARDEPAVHGCGQHERQEQ